MESLQRSPVVQIESGAVVGKIETLSQGKSVHEYLGIPYAEPPVGELRFAAPKPTKPWSGTKDATKIGACSPQLPYPIPVPETLKVEMNEDCLFLNVYVPSTTKPNDKKAVMVWIHGGGFCVGTAAHYPGGVLAAFNDVIVVSFNYRLGVLGFFNVPGTDVKGNYGMLDQVLALKWVQANIASFGGDPNNVTIFGADAGGMSVSLHLISPLSEGLFHRAIIQSGASSSPVICRKVTNIKQLELFAKAINCSLGPNLAECVREKTVEEILTGQREVTWPKSTDTSDIIVPTVDGEFLPDIPENLFKAGKFHANVDVIHGFNSNEGSLCGLMFPRDLIKDGMEQTMFESAVKGGFSYSREKSPIIEDLILFQYANHADPDDKIAIRQSVFDSNGDFLFVAPALLEAKALAKAGHLPYVYIFDHRAVHSTLPEWFTGSIHGMDVPFVFGAPFENISDPFTNMLTTKYSDKEEEFSLYVMKLWTDFAKYGSPNPPNSGSVPVAWPKFTEQEQAYLVLDLKPRVERRYKAEKMAFWNEIVPKVVEFTKAEKKEKPPQDEL